MKKLIEVGDIFTVEILKNERVKQGNPVCMLDGMVGFVKIPDGMIVLPRSVWQVEVIEVHVSGKNCVVRPIDKVKSAWENLREIDAKIKTLKHDKPMRKAKAKVKYTNI